MRLATRRWLSALMTSLLLAGACGGVLWLLSWKIAANLDEIAAQNATLEKLNAKTWGVTYLEDSNGRFLVLPKGMKAEAGWTVANGKRNAVKLVKE
ncbi:mobilization protein [Salmonella enterica]|uniref:Mobilization protein n=1 Tax=Salmonella enterica subsp. arizonae TaxID=59203 RepID=A0A5Y3Q566_SALER|nr:mobilization protein [Salmonella enterica]ECE6854942.1 mobilization protein [Salmonella enterica subsp. arizonae]ECU8519624.1 mobilization protein [Salmonella enterica subsp. arizonae serovar 44:z4,z23,z32:-]EAR4676989.1 mobilization protein [Salmonella enterica]EAU0104596.1 mobilization protein [Salmonella enterica]